MLDAKPDPLTIGFSFYKKLEEGGFVLQDDFLHFIFHSNRFNARERGQLFPADFNAKSDVVASRKSRERACRELKKNAAGNPVWFYASITRLSGGIVPLWGDEGELHYGGFNTKKVKAVLSEPALASHDPTKWQLEATTRPVPKATTQPVRKPMP